MRAGAPCTIPDYIKDVHSASAGASHYLVELQSCWTGDLINNAENVKLSVLSKLYLLAQVLEQNLFDPLNWLAGARLPQYSHFNTEEENKGSKYVTHLLNTDHAHRFVAAYNTLIIKSHFTTYKEVHSLSGQPGQNLCL